MSFAMWLLGTLGALAIDRMTKEKPKPPGSKKKARKKKK